MRYEDLPAALQKQVDAQLGRKPRAATGMGGGSTGNGHWRCVTCGEEFTVYAAVERHPHPRIECVLTGVETAR